LTVDSWQLIVILHHNFQKMAEVKKQEVKKQNVAAKAQNLFTKENYKWMLIGFIVIVIGVLIMIGGKSNDPNQFHKDEVYSFRGITLAPIIILAGLAIEIFAIFRKPAGQQQTSGNK